MNPEYTSSNSVIYRYRNSSQGWEVKCDPEHNWLFMKEAVVVSPIITKSTFNDDDEPEEYNQWAMYLEVIYEFSKSIEQETERIRNTMQYTDQDIDKPDDPEFRMYPEDEKVIYMRAWRGKNTFRPRL